MADVVLPPLPEENEDPWFEKRQAFDEAVRAQIEGPLSESSLAELANSVFEVSTIILTAADGEEDIALPISFTITSVVYSSAGRLRLYRTEAGRDADASRAFEDAYTGGSGLLYDYLAIGAETDDERPVLGALGDGETSIFALVEGPVDITINYVQTGA